jgi:hypothetical protein
MLRQSKHGVEGRRLCFELPQHDSAQEQDIKKRHKVLCLYKYFSP